MPSHGYALLLAFGAGYALLSQQVSGTRGTTLQKSEWAGSSACAICHSDIFRLQDRSNHARSLRPAGEIPELSGEPVFLWADRSSGATLEIHPGPRLSANKDGGQQSLLLDWAFGSGKKGITPVGRRGNGTFVESRLSWYANGGFGLTTGAGQRDASSFEEILGRNLSPREAAECFGCHTTGHPPGQLAPARHEMGIRCESCHGPGANHVRIMPNRPAAAAREILNPGKLHGPEQVRMCGTCHGPPPADSDVAALRRIERSPNTVRFPSQRLVLSRCYNESMNGLSCSQCHNPHTNVSTSAEAGDRACVACHVKPRRVCPQASNKCASCHMPKQQVMLHSLFTDHYIRVVERAEMKR